MKRRIKYSDEPIDLEVIDDFLPPPEKLAIKEENIKVTITLSKASVDFFKKYAKKQHSHYQKMIRKVIDLYVAHHS
jgi:predicted DNA binding CopG/RHH family protein